MGWFIFAVIFFVLFVIGVGVLVNIQKKLKAEEDDGSTRYDVDSWKFGRLFARIGTGIALVGGVLFMIFSTLVSNGVGEAKVYTNPDGTIAFTQTAPGFQVKAPWQEYADFDLFSQEVLYAGGDQAPSYSGGSVNGKEVTVSVGGVNGGSTQANLDISVTYSLDADQAEDIYRQYKSQERFTKQVIEKTILSTIRTVPGKYTAVEFRGDKRAEASESILSRLNEKLNSLGVTVDFVNLQDVRYPENVEKALADVEAANQAALKAEADLKAAQVAAQQKVVEAQATADANAILAQSLTPELLTQKYIDALSNGTTFVVPEGSTPFITAK